jgi:hypothetical protein
MKKLAFFLSIGFVLTSFTTMQGDVRGYGNTLSAMLTGAAERPTPGDPDGSGAVHLMLNQGQGTITYDLSVSGIAPATASHIHVGSATVAGPVVVTLMAPTSGSSTGVVYADPELIKAIRKNPENYYVNVHNIEYPAGAVRGQLSR